MIFQTLKTPKRIVPLIAMFLLLLYSFGCASVPVRSEDVCTLEEYLNFNTFVQNDLDVCFNDVFPSIIDKIADCSQYRYCYDCALLGDPNYFVWLRTLFPSKAAFSEEAERLKQLSKSVETIEESHHIKFIFIKGDIGDLELLLDDTIQDGRYYTLMMVTINDAEQSIDYLYLDEYDSSPHRDFIRSLLEINY